jgi:hypothetical protein
MSAIVWDQLAQRFFEAGVSKGVLYSQTAGDYNYGEAWNGLTAVNVSPSGGEASAQYADNIKYFNLFSAEEFGATIECFSAPDGFLVFDGVKKTANGLRIGQQTRPPFGFCWRTEKGNAVDEDLGYTLHFGYGLQATPSEKNYTTKNDSPEPTTFSWTVSSTAVPVEGYKAAAYVSIDSTDPTVDPENLAALELIIYGSPGVDPRLPMPDELDAILGSGVTLVTPAPQAYITGTHTIDYVAQPGVIFTREDNGDIVAADIVLGVGQTLVLKASPAPNYNFTGSFVDRWLYTY